MGENQLDIEDCVTAFSSYDFIMESSVFSKLRTFFELGGSPDQVVHLLSDNYSASAQHVNIFADWLICLGTPVATVKEWVEHSLVELVIKNFDPQKADSIFCDTSNEEISLSWVEDTIKHPSWRQMFYRLADEYPDCVLLNFVIKLISDAGYQTEIVSVATASQQVEVFLRVLCRHISSFSEAVPQSTSNDYSVDGTVKLCCYSEHTYLLSQIFLHKLETLTSGQLTFNIKWLRQQVEISAHTAGLDVSSVSLRLSNIMEYPRVYGALFSLLWKKSLNPADVNVLTKLYSAPNPPNPAFLHNPNLLRLLTESLFKPGVKINNEHKASYIFLLAFAASSNADSASLVDRSHKDDFTATKNAIDQAHNICLKGTDSHTDLLSNLNSLFHCIRYPVVAAGVLIWIESLVLDSKYFALTTEQTPLHLAILDEISTQQPLHHDLIFNLLKRLLHSTFDGVEVFKELSIKKVIVDRIIHLFSCGHAVPVCDYIRTCYEQGDLDVSLVRYFIGDVLDIVSPPYSPKFVSAFLPLLQSEELVKSMDSVKEQVASFIDTHASNSVN